MSLRWRGAPDYSAARRGLILRHRPTLGHDYKRSVAFLRPLGNFGRLRQRGEQGWRLG
jgi:hypothetical protein